MTCRHYRSDYKRLDEFAATMTRNRRRAVWSKMATALLALQLTAVGPAAAATTGPRDDDNMMAVGSHLAVATAAAPVAVGGATVPLEPVVAESKKLAAGKSATLDGYVLTGSSKGDKGYNEDDEFGGKDADSYGFGTQVSYGNKAGDGGNGAYHHSTAYDDNGRSNPKYSAWHFEEKDGKPTKRYVFDNQKKKKDPLAVEAEASEYDSVEAYDDGDDGGTHAGYEADEAEPEYGNLYDNAEAYNDADTYY